MAKSNTKQGPKRENVWWRHWFMMELYKAAVVVLALLLLTSILLKIITRHNNELEVPDFSGMTLDDAQRLANKKDLKLEVTDSVFMAKLGRGLIFKQNPTSGSMVKKNRRILLTINSLEPREVAMPSVVGYSLRQAKAELSAKQLSIGKLIYVSDMATNNVLSQRVNGKTIRSGEKIESGSEIDLELGDNGDEKALIPDILGLTLINAKEILTDNYLNIGKLTYDESVKTYSDTISSFVIKQSPEPTGKNSFTLGYNVDLLLSTDKTKLEKDIKK